MTFMDFSVGNTMATMVGLLTGADPDLQLDAAWCLTNMAAGTHDHALAVLKAAGPYLVTYLSSGNTPLQVRMTVKQFAVLKLFNSFNLFKHFK